MLEPGDRAPQFFLEDVKGRARSAVENRVAGKPVVLVFVRGTRPDLTDFAARLDDFAGRGTSLFVISSMAPAANKAMQQTLGNSFAVLWDKDGELAKKFGCTSRTVCVLDLDARILDIFQAEGTAADAERALAGVDAALQVAPEATLAMHAPVLVIPRALDHETCQTLIRAWSDLDNQAIEERGAQRNQASEAFFDTYGHVRQHVLRDPELLGHLDSRLPRRLGLEIHKAFQTRISRREDYRIACYEGAAGGSLGPHRDNMTKATEHRRFTASVQLNTQEYAGGELRFPEYGRQLYRGDIGTAIVFSASLLHEVVPVKAGRRFMLGTHLFGD